MGPTSGHLDRTGNARHHQTLKGICLSNLPGPSTPSRYNQSGLARWRLAAGIAVLVALAAFCALLARPYIQNWKLQSFVEKIAFDPDRSQPAPEIIAASVANRAAQLGIPLHVDQIRVTKSDAGVYIEGRYSVRVDMLFYTVNLHFRPSAGSR